MASAPSLGNDHYRTLKVPGNRRGLALTHLDLWFIVVLLSDFASDWEQFADRFRAERGALSVRTDAAEGLLNHLRGRRRRRRS